MMKKVVGKIALAFAVAVACFCFAACGDEQSKSYAVSFMKGEEELKSVSVTEGSRAESWTPVEDGMIFAGWYIDAEYTEEFDFSAAINKDVTLYAKFEAPLQIRVKGSYITGWEHITTDEYTMTYDFNDGLYKYTHQFIEGDSFCFYNFEYTMGEDGQIHAGLGKININADSVVAEQSTDKLDLHPSSNIMTNARGTYSFEYNNVTKKVVVTYTDAFEGGYTPDATWYIAGSGITSPLKESKFGNGLTDEHKLAPVEGEEHSYSITLDLAKGDLFQIVGNNWYARARKFDILEDAVVEDTTYFGLRGDNIEVKESGNYTLTLVLDPDSPLGDKITWVRNGDVLQELPIVFDVFMKCSADNWKPGDRLTAVDGLVSLQAHFDIDDQFCFIYYDPGVPDEEVGSYSNPGMLITNSMKGPKKRNNYNNNFGDFENNFLCTVAGYYIISIDFNSGTPVVNFTDFSETIPEYELIVKGPAYNGDPLWGASEKYYSQNGVVELTLTLTQGETQTMSEFGFTWWDERASQYGNWIGTTSLGTDGDANEYMVKYDEEGKKINNFVCQRTGKYRIVIFALGTSATINFYVVD